MKATVTCIMKDGRQFATETDRENVFAFVEKHGDEIKHLTAKICLTRWTFKDGQWSKKGTFHYVPNHPELWNRSS